jgi:aryl-alcohol dehydrogenase-like predicted oxidoreductase
MRRVMLGETGIAASCLGFGCAALGSRIEARAGLRALEEAFEGGVTWFDLAPVYGAGQAEAIAAPFIAAHRGEVQVCTKVGLGLAAGAGLRRRLAPLARRALAMSDTLAAGLRRAAPRANARLPLTPALLHGSLETSLRRLGTDHVTLYALHVPAAQDLARPEIRRALEDIVASGKARAVGVAGDAAATEVALGIGAPYGTAHLPMPGTGAEAALAGRVRAAGWGQVTHSVFGAPGQDGGKGVGKDGGKDGGKGGGDPCQRLRRAFALNPAGIVLASMFSEAHRRADLAVADEAPGPFPADPA